MVEIVLDFLKYIFNFGRHTIYRLNQRLCILGRIFFLNIALTFLMNILRKEMFYLTTHSTHFIYGYMVSDIW